MLPFQPPPAPDEVLVPPVTDDQMPAGCVSWQLLSVSLHRTPTVGFGIAVSGGRDNPHFASGDPAVVISDVVPNGPAWGLLQVNDRILSANGVSFESIEYGSAVDIIKNAEQISMIVKRRVAMPIMEFEQRTLKFTLTKSRKKDDFGIVLGCKFYIKEIRNPKLAEKDPGLKEGDSIMRINGQSVEGASLEECNKWLDRSRDKLCLVIQRDVRRGTSRWPSQNTVYERVGGSSVTHTPRHSPSPMMHQPLSQRSSHEYMNSPRWRPDGSVEDSHRRVSSPATSVPSQSEYDHYVRSQNGKPDERGQRNVMFRKVGGSVGVRVIGGNEVGIFVSAVAADSPAALHGVCCGDKILEVNGRSMNGVSREAAVQLLLALDDRVSLRVEHSRGEFEQVRNSQLGDNFYIRSHFSKEKKGSPLELSVNEGDIFHVTDTLFGGTVGLWQAARVYSASSVKGEPAKGVIPNQTTAESLAREQRRVAEPPKKGGTLLRRKLESRRTKSLPKNLLADPAELSASIPLPAYERVALNTPSFHRPLVLFGPLADVARQQLLSQFALRFAEPEGDGVIRLAQVDTVIQSGKHCVVDISVESVERLQLAQYAPIVILIDVESRSRVRDLRKKANAPHQSSKKLVEQAQQIKKHHAHLLSATVDASQEDGWFDALRDLIAHLQQRRLWMPEFPPNIPLEDVLLFPMSNRNSNNDSDMESSKGDYGDYSQRSDLIIGSPMARSVYEWDRSQATPMAGTTRDPSISSENSSALPHHIGTTPRLGVSASRFATLPRRLTHAVEISLEGSDSRLCVSPSNVLTSHPSNTLCPSVSDSRRHSNETGRISADSGRHPIMNTGYFHVKQLLNDDSLYSGAPETSRISAEMESLLINDGKKSTEERQREEANQRLNDAAAQLREATQRLQAPLQPPNPDMYSPRTEHPPTNGYGSPLSGGSSGYGSSAQQKAANSNINGNIMRSQPLVVPRSLSAQAPPLQPRPQIAPKPNLLGDSIIRNRWMEAESHLPSSNADIGGIATNNPLNGNSLSSPNVPLVIGSKISNNGNRNTPLLPQNNTTVREFTENSHIMLNPDSLSSSERRELSPASDVKVEEDNSLPDKASSDDEPIVIEETSQLIDSEGGVLCCPVSRVELRIPKGALPPGQKHEIYVKVCQEGSGSPPIDTSRGEALLSPLVMCGPQGLNFLKPAELRLPHNGGASTDQWSFSLKTGEGGEWTHLELDEQGRAIADPNYLSVPINSF